MIYSHHISGPLDGPSCFPPGGPAGETWRKQMYAKGHYDGLRGWVGMYANRYYQQGFRRGREKRASQSQGKAL